MDGQKETQDPIVEHASIFTMWDMGYGFEQNLPGEAHNQVDG